MGLSPLALPAAASACAAAATAACAYDACAGTRTGTVTRTGASAAASAAAGAVVRAGAATARGVAKVVAIEIVDVDCGFLLLIGHFIVADWSAGAVFFFLLLGAGCFEMCLCLFFVDYWHCR
jgi:hypothetical protein